MINLLRLSIITSLLFVSTASAHKLNIFVWTEGDRVVVESSLSGGRKLANGAVKIIDLKTGQTVVTGMTDKNGSFSFTIPAAVRNSSTTLDIIVSGGDGHQAHWQLELQNPDRDSSAPIVQTPALTNPAIVQEPESQCLDRATFELLLDEHLEKKLQPLRTTLNLLATPSPTLKDIGGGIGYLVGGAGLIAWFRNRRPNKP